jgi:hypothetical protein
MPHAGRGAALQGSSSIGRQQAAPGSGLICHFFPTASLSSALVSITNAGS